MIFAVFDPSPLTVCINCSFFYIYHVYEMDVVLALSEAIRLKAVCYCCYFVVATDACKAQDHKFEEVITAASFINQFVLYRGLIFWTWFRTMSTYWLCIGATVAWWIAAFSLKARVRPAVYISTSGCAELTSLSHNDSHLLVGSRVTFTQLETYLRDRLHKLPGTQLMNWLLAGSEL